MRRDTGCVAEAWAQALGNNRHRPHRPGIRQSACTAPHGIPGPAAVPACMVRDSEFFTASLAVPLPARRVLHTSHPKDETSLGPRFFKVKTFLQLCDTLYHVRGLGKRVALLRARRKMGVATARVPFEARSAKNGPVCQRALTPHSSVPPQSRAVWRRGYIAQETFARQTHPTYVPEGALVVI